MAADTWQWAWERPKSAQAPGYGPTWDVPADWLPAAPGVTTAAVQSIEQQLGDSRGRVPRLRRRFRVLLVLGLLVVDASLVKVGLSPVANNLGGAIVYSGLPSEPVTTTVVSQAITHPPAARPPDADARADGDAAAAAVAPPPSPIPAAALPPPSVSESVIVILPPPPPPTPAPTPTPSPTPSPSPSLPLLTP
jgi:hypothetical protein